MVKSVLRQKGVYQVQLLSLARAEGLASCLCGLCCGLLRRLSSICDIKIHEDKNHRTIVNSKRCVRRCLQVMRFTTWPKVCGHTFVCLFQQHYQQVHKSRIKPYTYSHTHKKKKKKKSVNIYVKQTVAVVGTTLL